MSEIKKPYEFRQLKSIDILPMIKIINLVGIDQFKNCFDDFGKIADAFDGAETDDESQLISVGVGVLLNITGVILSGYERCEKELFQFLSSVSNLKFKDMQELDLSVFAEFINDFLQKEELGDFIKVVSKFLPSAK